MCTWVENWKAIFFPFTRRKSRLTVKGSVISLSNSAEITTSSSALSPTVLTFRFHSQTRLVWACFEVCLWAYVTYRWKFLTVSQPLSLHVITMRCEHNYFLTLAEPANGNLKNVWKNSCVLNKNAFQTWQKCEAILTLPLSVREFYPGCAWGSVKTPDSDGRG